MWQSGYVVVPTSSGCCISVTLQVDPKVGRVGQAGVCVACCWSCRMHAYRACSAELGCCEGCTLLINLAFPLPALLPGLDPHHCQEPVPGGHPPQHPAREGRSGAPGAGSHGVTARVQQAAGRAVPQAPTGRGAGQAAARLAGTSRGRGLCWCCYWCAQWRQRWCAAAGVGCAWWRQRQQQQHAWQQQCVQLQQRLLPARGC
jgi:hypothetical protein